MHMTSEYDMLHAVATVATVAMIACVGRCMKSLSIGLFSQSQSQIQGWVTYQSEHTCMREECGSMAIRACPRRNFRRRFQRAADAVAKAAAQHAWLLGGRLGVQDMDSLDVGEREPSCKRPADCANQAARSAGETVLLDRKPLSLCISVRRPVGQLQTAPTQGLSCLEKEKQKPAMVLGATKGNRLRQTTAVADLFFRAARLQHTRRRCVHARRDPHFVVAPQQAERGVVARRVEDRRVKVPAKYLKLFHLRKRVLQKTLLRREARVA
mmetsp:Transcript_16420/g.48913  ORF Transcript_16420/g.48913 Transcript_16420/m.48913 type:complete len:268 (+) Transcript_16420:186-989(+)|eukprot:352122-Chlamydomonas_euryale.AAC.14